MNPTVKRQYSSRPPLSNLTFTPTMFQHLLYHATIWSDTPANVLSFQAKPPYLICKFISTVEKARSLEP
jgi:hypothetical protein